MKDQLPKIITKLDNLDTIQQQLTSLQKKITGTDGIQHKVERALTDLEDIQQYTMINNLIISGIPDLENFEPKQVALDLANYLGVDIGLNNIDTAHRLPTKIKGKDRPIIVRFVNRWAKEEISGKVMEKNRQKDCLNTKRLGYVTPQQAVYVNEHLSPGLQEILYHAGRRLRERKKSTKSTFNVEEC